MKSGNEDLSLLISITEDVAQILDTEDLLFTAFQKLHTFYGINIGGGALFDRSRENLGFNIIRIEEGKRVNESMVWLHTAGVNSSPFNLALMNSGITYIDADDFHNFRPKNLTQAALTEVLREMNISKLPLIPVRSGGELIGFLILALEHTGLENNPEDYLIKLANLIGLIINNANSYQAVEYREKEKEIQLGLLADLVTIRDKEELFIKLAFEADKLIPCNFLAIYSEYKNMDLSGTVSLVKDEKNQFRITSLTRSTVLFLIAMKAKVETEGSQGYTEVSGEEFDALCEKFSHLKQLREKHSLNALLVLHYSFGDLGGLTLVVGRDMPNQEVKTYSALDLIFLEDSDSFFKVKEIELAMNLLPYLGLILSNFYAFEEINSLTKKLEQEKNYLLDEINLTNNVQEIIGNSSQINLTLNKVKQVAPLDATVLILGETGTGKELIAKAIHTLSKRKDNTFITVNCAALPVQLIESELFGHEKGSFTGALEKRIGKFEVANGGTIFLDEIGELPLEIQAKLLRVLQEKEFERLGGKSTVRSDVRIVAATNRNLEKEVEQGKFRSDLFFRLNVFPIVVPPLRERKDDIPLLIKYFLDKYSKKLGKELKSIRKSDLDMLINYHWPGNVRELEHLIERTIIVSEGSNLNFSKLVDGNLNRTEADHKSFKTLVEIEKEHIINALKLTKGKVTGENSAALLLGINGKTLGSKMRKLNIKREIVIRAEKP